MGEVVLSNRFPEILAAVEVARDKLLRKAAFDIQALAANTAPVDTGFLKSSIYTRTHTASTYGQGVGGGATGGFLLPEVEKPDQYTAYVAVGASYGIYVEFGTSRMAAQPYLVPAADTVMPVFIAAWGKLEDYLKAASLAGGLL